ncbi:MAG: 6,7-dimethyl-8-ribityllumazine synthase [Prevotellaceae bacterium]|jgi:6,7-dimethyl-8-ribityllumazine synthase|nr:6,7-dimethyl-8-ribityllumazine synthase [Prevotellaceae bacterium]
MATQYQNPTDYNLDGTDKSKLPEQQYALIVADWHPQVTHAMLDGAVTTLTANSVKPEHIKIIHVPGAFELTYAAKQLMDDYYCMIDGMKVYKYVAIIVIGCVIQGETPHFDYVCQSVTQGITVLNTRRDGCPAIFGVLTTKTLEQALERAGGKYGNKGAEAAITAIKMANIIW